jgi:2'-5' RNA ligase
LDSRFIREGFCPTPYPHLSFHVAEGYDLAALAPGLARVAASTPRLRLRASGLGLFTVPAHPVLYLTVVRDPALSEFHRMVWEEVKGFCTGRSPHYDPSSWVPHITLAQGETLSPRLPEIVDLLWRRDFNWEIEIDSLSFIYDDGERQGVEMSFNLTPPSATFRVE